MAEQELRKKIAIWIHKHFQLYSFEWEKTNAVVRDKYLRDADQILALIKEAGYVIPPESIEITELAEVLYNFRNALDIKSIKENIQSFLLANRYGKLAEDQTLAIP